MTRLTHSVRLQLRLAFCFAIAISFLSTALAIVRFQDLSAETAALIHRSLAKQRLIAGLARQVALSRLDSVRHA